MPIIRLMDVSHYIITALKWKKKLSKAIHTNLERGTSFQIITRVFLKIKEQFSRITVSTGALERSTNGSRLLPQNFFGIQANIVTPLPSLRKQNPSTIPKWEIEKGNLVSSRESGILTLCQGTWSEYKQRENKSNSAVFPPSASQSAGSSFHWNSNFFRYSHTVKF